MRKKLSLALAITLAGLVAVISCGDEGALSPGDAGEDNQDSARTPSDARLALDATDALSAPDAADTRPPSDAADAADSADAREGGLSPTFVFFDVNHVLSTGQSLSVGSQGAPVLSDTQPYSNIKFSRGVLAGGTGLTAFAPLTETNVETMSSSLANLVTRVAREELLTSQPAGRTSHDILVSAHGVGGTAYIGLKKGTTPYTNGLAQATAGHALAMAAGKTHAVRVVTTVHGESDHVSRNPSYEANLVEWQSDYQTDIRVITGQTSAIPLLQTQMSSHTKLGQTTSLIPVAQLAAHVNHPGLIVLVGPKYHLEYAPDGVHLSNEGYRHMGEDYAKVYRRIILEGRPWEPVRPTSVTRVGAVVTVKFHVPAPPLTFDTTLVTDPGNFGFEYSEDPGGTPPRITAVSLSGVDTVTLTLSSAPTGTGRRLRYAFTGLAGARGGPTTGARGNLRDSDATASRAGYKLYNWCVHFDEPLP